MRRFALATAAAAALALGTAGAASADAPVNVTIGPELAAKAGSYGERDLQNVAKWLDQSVTRAIANRADSPVVSADLVLADAVPNRPTFAQMGRNVQISMLGSVGLGGATIKGTVTTADGQTHPVAFAWYENWIQNEIGATTWRDAERAFQMVSSRIAKGDIPQQSRLMAPTGNGDYGAWRTTRNRIR